MIYKFIAILCNHINKNGIKIESIIIINVVIIYIINLHTINLLYIHLNFKLYIKNNINKNILILNI